MYGNIVKYSDLLNSLSFLNDYGEDGYKVYTTKNVFVAEKIDGEVVLKAGEELKLNTECVIIENNIMKKDIEIGDILYLKNGSILRAITKNDDHSDHFSLEVLVRKNMRDTFNPVSILWRDNFYYGVTGVMDIVKVKKLDGSVHKTDMWHKHFQENKTNLAKVTLLVNPEKALVDEDLISYYNSNGFLNVCSDDLGEYINVYGDFISEYEAINIDAVEDYYIKGEN